jgi:hypothetical protein
MHFVTINRKGFVARATIGKGEKRIPLVSIDAVPAQTRRWGDERDSFSSRCRAETSDVRSSENKHPMRPRTKTP